MKLFTETSKLHLCHSVQLFTQKRPKELRVAKAGILLRRSVNSLHFLRLFQFLRSALPSRLQVKVLQTVVCVQDGGVCERVAAYAAHEGTRPCVRVHVF